jgi:signal transduction histidine kinase
MGHVLNILSFSFLFLATARSTLLDPFSAMSQDANTLHAIPDPTLVVSRGGELLYANGAARRDLGAVCDLSRGGRPFDAAGSFLGNRDVAQRIAAGEALQSGTVLRLGSAFYDASATPIRGREQGDGSVVVLRDITPRVVAEQQKESALRALERSTAELEQYAYVASHDLQEPMRQVASYVGLLERRYAGQLGKDADEYIQFAVEGVHRLQSIVQDLLLFSRVAHGPVTVAAVDVRACVESALTGAASLIAQVGAVVHVPGDMPPVMADPAQITEVFRRLIDNALIYRHPGRRPDITITARADGPMVEFSVQDNGVGIDPMFHQRVFELFKRLQTREHHDGNGVGLPVVRQIVERHGGTVSLHSAPNDGTDVTFTLRAAD